MHESSDDEIGKIRQLISEYSTRDLNEADTRHKIIDVVLHDILSWPRNRVSVEEYISPGYADYVLKKANGDDLLFIEAKREGVFFTLPIAHNKAETSSYISINILLTDPAIKKAMTQVRTYCLDTGCDYASITNGHEWIFFRIYEKGKRWENLKAFVIRKMDFFEKEYTKAVNSFCFTAITENSSLSELLSTSEIKDRVIYFPKDKIASYSHTITSNRLAPILRPVINKYFGVIDDNDSEFMDRCYVSQREYDNTSDGMKVHIQDSLSPYFAEYGVKQLEDTGKGGRLGGRLSKNFKKNRGGEVLVLFGGKGAGKSTFIKRLLHHNPPPWLRDHSVIAIIDLLKVPEDKNVIRKEIWDKLVERLDLNGLLGANRTALLNGIFADRFDVAKKQELFGLSPNTDAYNLKLNELVSEWKKDKRYCAEKLVAYWNSAQKGIIVVLDNTDQYSSGVQDFCFTSAQEICNELKCVTLISMREERFHDSKIHGLLDAFQNAGFHISSPKPAEVFRKRLQYTIGLLNKPSKRANLINVESPSDLTDSVTYLGILNREFSLEASPLNKFLSASAHGDIRLSLDLFRSFLLSGYTNVGEMIAAGNWNFQIHQVIKPVMIPNRYFYDENLSDIPNIYQVRCNRRGSHFSSLRILRKLSKNIDRSTPAYLDLSVLKSYFIDTFNMREDFEKNMDMLLKRGFIESNNRLDSYSQDVDKVKITNYGMYMLNDLAFHFTYIDLICTDCGIFSGEVSNFLSEAARVEYQLFQKDERLKRVEKRLERVKHFLDYLALEEQREKELYSLGMPDTEMFTYKAKAIFEVEEQRVLKSARRQPGR